MIYPFPSYIYLPMDQSAVLFEAKVTGKEQENHNIIKLEVEYSHKLPVTTNPFHIRIYNEDLSYSRPYTPIQTEGSKFIFMIKIYPDGRMSKYFSTLEIGDVIKTSGIFEAASKDLKSYKQVLLIAGGTGITPIYQVLKYNIHNKCKYTLINLNSRKIDIFMKKEMNQLKQFENLEIIDFLSQEEEDEEESFYSGRLNKEKLEDLIKDMSIDFVYICGSPSLLESFSGKKISRTDQGKLAGILKELGFTEDSVFKF